MGTKNMKRFSQWLGAASIVAYAAVIANPAQAASAAAGSTITNNVTVNYQVGGFAQNQEVASDSFTVDRKVNLTVAESGTSTTQVSPGQTSAVTTFTVTNLSNDTLDFALVAAQQTGGAGAHSNTDNFDVSNVRIYVESGSVAGYDATDTLVTYLDGLLAEGSKTVYVVVDVPTGRATGDVAAVTLTATAREAATSGTMGNALTETAGVNTSGMDTVFADGAGATDSSRNADFSAKDDYTVLAALLTAEKTSKVISDGFNSFPNAKAIPGAIIEYCIRILNAAGGATATGISIADTLPAEVTYDSSYGIKIGGTVDGSNVCQTDGSSGGSFAAGAVSGTIASLPAGEVRTLLFRAAIN